MLIDHIERKLKTLTVHELAKQIGARYDVLRYFLVKNGTDVNKIKKDYTIYILCKLSKNNTLKEMVNITGFSRRKILYYSKNGYVTFKFSDKKQ